MGNNYSVDLDIKVKKDCEKMLLEELDYYVREGHKKTHMNGVDFGKKPSALKTLEDYIMVMLANDNENVYKYPPVNGFNAYHNDFSCCYSWESVMFEMWEIISKYCEDDSTYTASMDEGGYEYKVIGGENVLVRDWDESELDYDDEDDGGEG